jgi:hypothetical protein
VRKRAAGDVVVNLRNFGAIALLVVGLTQMIGDLSGNRALKGIGAATAIAPSPKVFCDINGVEPFASTFFISSQNADDGSFRITPELYSRLRGPYNRRNVYGAAIAGAPLLPPELRQSVLRYAFVPDGPLARELHLTSDARVVLTLRTNTRGRNNVWRFECE